MNISGPQYSASTVGLRQPKKILDQQFKLVFIYPMLCDSTVMKYKEIIRTFLSVSVLKEIKYSEAISAFNTGSNISSLVDEHGNVIDIDDHVLSKVDSPRSMGLDNPLRTKHDIQQSIKQDVQDQIKERTAYIQQLLNIDPQLKQYKPYLEMLTMSNFIKMPIIVGTKCFDINKIVMLMVLVVAVSDKNITMSSYPDIEKIFRLIKNLPSNDLNSVLNHLIDLPVKNETVKEKLLTWLSGNIRPQTGSRDLTRLQKIRTGISNRLNNTQSRLEKQRSFAPKTKQFANYTEPNSIQNYKNNYIPDLIDISNSEISKANIFFKLCMNPEDMARQFGYDSSRGQLKTTFDRINPRINSVFNRVNQLFADSIWPGYIAPVLSSFLYTIVPRDSGINISDILISLQNGDNSKNIKGIFGPILQYITVDLKKELNNVMEKQGPDKADETLARLKSICIQYFPGSSKNIEDTLTDITNTALTGPDYEIDDHIAYEKTFEKIIANIIPEMHTIESVFKEILPNSVIDNLLISQTSKVINDGLNSVITYFNTFTNYPVSTSFFQNENPRDIPSSNISGYISSSKKQIIFYIRRFILYMIQDILCHYVDEVKIAVETTKNDVLDGNNYSLILPLETILILANAYAAKSYRDLYNKSTRNEKNVNTNQSMELIKALDQNYVQKIIKLMYQRLDIPNLFVIDEKKQIMYYKLMYQSNINKINLSTIQTYVNSILSMHSIN